ncbi:MAG TPA: AAA family ATPase, partial [Methyloradius sp.]
MLTTLNPESLTVQINANALGFSDTSEFTQAPGAGWIGQAEAETAARFGLTMRQPGFHLIVLGEAGSGRTSLTLELMQEIAAQSEKPHDLAILYNIESPETPITLYLQAGVGIQLRQAMDAYIRLLAKSIPTMLSEVAKGENKTEIESAGKHQAIADFLTLQLAKINNSLQSQVIDGSKLSAYLNALKQDTLENIEVFQASSNDADGDLESLLSRYRVNLLVDHRNAKGAPVIYDDDPSMLSLFGGLESTGDGNNTPDFMRIRAGNLLKANGGMLMLHMRDIHADQQNGSQIIEKLHRFLRNGHVQVEESSGASAQSSAGHCSLEPLKAVVKLVLIASREDYYALQEESYEFARHFKIKVDFVESFSATPANYQAVAQYISQQCAEHNLPHFTADAVAVVIRQMQRRIDDQTRISTDFAHLRSLVFESAAIARDKSLVSAAEVEAALKQQYQRHQYPEQQLRHSIIDGELLINLKGKVVGQINGLSHIDLGDASFGSPVRISARCHAGDKGVINIDREVKMSGPNHDKGIFILQSWLSASFANLAPLAMHASIVFEQEYYGVEGDSASCAELFALLSDLSGLALPQGIAVTGALNQHGEVMPIGGVNEKIEGYFRVCQQSGLDGTQGVIIPARNQSHLLLAQEVIHAV